MPAKTNKQHHQTKVFTSAEGEYVFLSRLFVCPQEFDEFVWTSWGERGTRNDRFDHGSRIKHGGGLNPLSAL